MADRKQPTQQDYQMDVIIRQFCRIAEEAEMLVEEVDDIQQSYNDLLIENATLRFQLVAAGVDVAPSEYLPSEDDTEFWSHVKRPAN